MPAKIEIDLVELEKICQFHPTDAELAAYFNCTQKTIQRKKNAKDRSFAEAMERGFSKSNLSLRRKQIGMALEGNVALLIWLGKQFLGQSDKQQLEHSITKSVEEEWDDV